jgi:hypothetical protein
MSRPLPCGSGDTRRAALRPTDRPQCWFFPLARVCPTVMPERSPHHEDAFGASCVVRIDAHGSKDRAKDASAERMRRSLVPASVHTLGAHARRRSPPRRPPDIRCHRRAVRRGRIPATAQRTDQGLRSDDRPWEQTRGFLGVRFKESVLAVALTSACATVTFNRLPLSAPTSLSPLTTAGAGILSRSTAQSEDVPSTELCSPRAHQPRDRTLHPCGAN